MRGRKKMGRDQVKIRAFYARFRIEDAKRVIKASSKSNKTYSEFIRDAVLDKLKVEGF